MMTSARDRCAGALWGLAAGDKNHGPMRMAALLALSIAQTHGAQTQGTHASNAQFAFDGAHAASKYYRWFYNDDPFECLDMGNTFRTVFLNMSKGMSNEEAARKFFEANPENAGINSAHRSIPIAMAFCIPDDHILSLTYSFPSIFDIAQCMNVILRELIKGKSYSEALGTAKNMEGLNDAILKALNNANGSKLSKGGYAPDVLEAAIHFVTTNPETEPERALAASLKFAGLDNFCPVLVGALVGARAGRNALRERAPHEFSHITIKVKPHLESASRQLAEMWPLELSAPIT